MYCWYCYWGWPRKVYDIYMEALDQLEGNMNPLHFGPAHVVWEDENFHSAEWCLENFDEHAKNLTDKERTVVRQSLEKLVKIPLEERDPEPDGYGEGCDPSDYPPPAWVEMVK